MTRKSLRTILAGTLMATSCLSASAFDINDLLNQLSKGIENGTVTDIIEGVLSKSNLEVRDLAGEWTVAGSAISFKSQDFLSQAGGTAIASTIESKLNPYFTRYKLTGGVFTIQTDGTFTLKVKKTTVKGTITKGTNNNFVMTFQAFGKYKLGSVNLYAQKTSSSLDLMFDVSKLQSIITSVAKLSNSTIAKTITNTLASYDGICAGFELTKTGTVPGESSSSSILDLFKDGSSSSNSNGTTNSDSTENKSQDKGSVKDLFNKKK